MTSINFEKIKILIIDDDELIRLTMKSALKKLGCTVFEAENGNGGVTLFQKERPDLVITDILMPDKEGLETISEIHALDPKAKIIAISGGGSARNMAFLQLAQKIGASHIMSKPIRPDDLLKAVKSLFNAD
jgi:YesN/AraC family two-component response regulator